MTAKQRLCCVVLRCLCTEGVVVRREGGCCGGACVEVASNTNTVLHNTVWNSTVCYVCMYVV